MYVTVYDTIQLGTLQSGKNKLSVIYVVLVCIFIKKIFAKPQTHQSIRIDSTLFVPLTVSLSTLLLFMV